MQPRRLAAIGALAVVTVGAVALFALDDADDPVSAPADAAPSATADTAASADDHLDTLADVDGAETMSVEPDPEPAALRYDPELVPELANRGEHPPLLGIEGWLQSDVESLEDLRGSIVAVQFWTFGCHNCRATMPHMAALYEKYGGDDFEIIGVHAPEFDWERDPAAIADAAAEQNVTWPIALDGEKQTFRSWQTGRRFWPRIYLIDRDGDIRYDKIGEGRYDEIDAAVGALIDEPWDAELAAELEEWVERDVDLNSDPM